MDEYKRSEGIGFSTKRKSVSVIFLVWFITFFGRDNLEKNINVIQGEKCIVPDLTTSNGNAVVLVRFTALVQTGISQQSLDGEP